MTYFIFILGLFFTIFSQLKTKAKAAICLILFLLFAAAMVYWTVLPTSAITSVEIGTISTSRNKIYLETKNKSIELSALVPGEYNSETKYKYTKTEYFLGSMGQLFFGVPCKQSKERLEVYE